FPVSFWPTEWFSILFPFLPDEDNISVSVSRNRSAGGGLCHKFDLEHLVGNWPMCSGRPTRPDEGCLLQDHGLSSGSSMTRDLWFLDVEPLHR
ncbi:hypothetical protein COCC4DRAFT_33645, partial [Bipolaris maydis ATCC 48331]